MNDMKSDKDLLKLMDHFDGLTEENASQEFLEELKELNEVRDKLKKLPLEDSDLDTDKRFYSFLESEKKRSSAQSIIQWLWPYVALAASVVLILYIFLPKDLSERYEALASNTDKVGFVYALNNDRISADDYLWLLSLLESEKNPNIRITVIDLIEQQQEQLPASVAQLLKDEQIPTVQMALLNTIEKKYNPDMKGHLLAFNEREDLDQLVRQRIADILTEK